MQDLSSITSESLCAQVVAYRAFKINKQIAEDCMAELLKRKANNDAFDFEAFINAELDKLPKPQTGSLDGIFSILSSNSKDFIKNIKNDKK